MFKYEWSFPAVSFLVYNNFSHDNRAKQQIIWIEIYLVFFNTNTSDISLQKRGTVRDACVYFMK